MIDDDDMAFIKGRGRNRNGPFVFLVVEGARKLMGGAVFMVSIGSL